MALWILRSVFLLVSAGVGFSVINSPGFEKTWGATQAWLLFLAIMGSSVVVVTDDYFVPRKKLEFIS
jgi:hypothetical protein